MLHESRPIGLNGPGGIQISEVAAYCAICGYSNPSDRLDLLLMVKALDAEWLDWFETQKPKKKPGKGR